MAKVAVVGMTVVKVLVGGGSAAAFQVTLKNVESI